MKLLRSTALLLLLCSTTLVAHADNQYPAQVIKTTNQLSLYWRDVFSVDGTGEIEPLHRLSRELKGSKANIFRLKWEIFAPNYPTSTTVLYNRKSGQLSCYTSTEPGGLGNEHFHGPQVIHWVMSGVKDKYIHQLAKKYSHPSSNSGDAYLSELVYFGCKIRYLRKP